MEITFREHGEGKEKAIEFIESVFALAADKIVDHEFSISLSFVPSLRKIMLSLAEGISRSTLEPPQDIVSSQSEILDQKSDHQAEGEK